MPSSARVVDSFIMSPTLLGARHPPTRRQAARTEGVLAVGRAFLTVTALVAIYLDPREPARLREVTYGVLLAYAIYSLAVLAYVNGVASATGRHGLILHGLDILWTSALTFVSEGPVSPFFLFFLFVVLAGAYRWGFRETAGTAIVTVVIFLTETAVAAAGPWKATWFASIEFELNRTILRLAYLLLTGVLLGYLAEQEKHSRAELAAIASAARQPHINLGLGGSIGAVGRALLSTFDAASVAIVVRDLETRRTLLWQVDQGNSADGRTPNRRSELNAQEQAAWLFEDFGRAWHTTLQQRDSSAGMVRVTEPERWRLSRMPGALPAEFSARRPFSTVAAVNMGFEGEWQARAYLFDVRQPGGLERRLHFLEDLTEHVTPGLTNVFLLRRLRARAGAAERARVARELHDGAIQALFGIEMKIEAIRRQANLPPAAVDTELAQIQELVRSEVLALRELMQALRPTELDSSDQLPDVLAGLVERFRRDTGISARFIPAVTRISVSPQKAIEIVRMVQEALVNVRKHSEAKNVLVRLSVDHGVCSLVVEDDGRGFDFDGRLSARELDDRRLGPAIIKERARIAGAALTIDSTPGSGSRLELTFDEEAHD
jgi:signal transduction histidine kinase